MFAMNLVVPKAVLACASVVTIVNFDIFAVLDVADSDPSGTNCQGSNHIHKVCPTPTNRALLYAYVKSPVFEQRG